MTKPTETAVEEATKELCDLAHKTAEEVTAELPDMDRECLETHYVAAMANWTIALEQRDRLEKELAAVRSEQPAEITIGVGDGRGNLFVHGSFESIEAVKRIMARAEQSQVCVNPSVHPQPCQVCGPQEMIRCRCGHETWTQPQVGHGGTLENAITAASFILDKQEVVRLRHAIQLVRRCKPGNANPMLTESKLALMLAEARLEVLRKIVDIEVGKDRFHAIKDIEYLFLEARAEVERLKNA